MSQTDIPDTILERIQKLFSLSESPNENEASVALAMAMKLLAKYQMSLDEFQHRTTEDDSISESTIVADTSSWSHRLFTNVAYSCFCKVLLNAQDRKYFVLGNKINREACISTYMYLLSVVNIEADRAYKQDSPQSMYSYQLNGSLGIQWLYHYKSGMVERLGQRLIESRESVIKGSQEAHTDVVVYDPYKLAIQDIERYIKGLGMDVTERGHDKTSPNSMAYQMGKEAANKIDLNNNKKGLE